MSRFSFSSTPLEVPALQRSLVDPSCGGYAAFEGWVRNHNEGQEVRHLEYEAFEELAVREGERIIAEACKKYGVDNARCVHRVGDLALGEIAVWVGVSARHRDEAFKARRDPTPDSPVKLHGLGNLALIGVIILAILMSAAWKPGVAFTVMGTPVEWQNLARDGIFVLVTLASLALTKKEFRERNGFTWGPILEVAKLFAGIFITMIPVLAMLKAGKDGAFAPLVALVTHPDGSPNNAAYFWMTGILSSFLDNAPTYLVFFELAGGDPATLMTKGAMTLAAVSLGAVFMGANSYIGNAPNFMVYAIARDGGVKMPSFFGYMLWSGAFLIPCFVLVTFIFFR